jgi:AraC family transcriptional regulator of adaptative response / DNA-3-methyladenine glycosylase II
VGQRYSRTVSLKDGHGIIDVQPDASDGFLRLTLRGVETASLFEVVQRCRELFDLDAPVADIADVLGKDDALSKLLKRHKGVRVPGYWDGFELTVRAILGQQVSVKAATTIAGRIASSYGEALSLPPGVDSKELRFIFPVPERLMRARLENVGIIRSRADTIRAVARAVVNREVNFDPAQDPVDFCKSLQQIKGIGDWTAQYIAMRALKNPDAFPSSDLGLIKAIDPPQRTAPATLLARAESWRPWRAYAALLLWGSEAGSGG